MNQESVTCDGCGKDITTTGNCVDYRLALVVESIPCGRNMVTLLHVTPPLNRDHHFCGVGCLKNWITKGDQL